MDMVLKVTTGAGITSCLSVRLHDFCQKQNWKEITTIDSTQQFSFYTDWLKHIKGVAFTTPFCNNVYGPFDFTKVKDLVLPNYDHGFQYAWYDEIDLPNIHLLAKEVCKLNHNIYDRSKEISSFYGLKDRCSVIYRGNDKAKEIEITPYDAIVDIAFKSGYTKFFLQTDEVEFYQYFTQKFPDTLSNENIPRIKTDYNSYVVSENLIFFVQEFLATLYALSTASYAVITNTGNIGMWSAIFRGNLNNFYQYHSKEKTYRKLG
jgi:hypothetical protein